MLKVSQMEKLTVYKPKKGQTGDVSKMKRGQLSSIGKIHLTVCSPSGKRVVGFLIRRPDIAGMVKQKDAFIALDSFAVCDFGLVATRGDGSFDDVARERLGLPWEKCIIWAGMDAKTTNGREMGWVNDFSFDAKSGRIQTFFVGDGGVASSLVGFVEVPCDMLRGYENGFMLLDPEAAKLALDGGLAAKAGEGYARAKMEGKAAGKKAAKVAGTAVEKGAYGLGRLIGKAKRSIEDYQREDDDTENASEDPVEIESISEPVNGGLLVEGESNVATDEAHGATADGTGAGAEAPRVSEAGEVLAQEGDEGVPTMRTFVPASEVVDSGGAEGSAQRTSSPDDDVAAIPAPEAPEAGLKSGESPTDAGGDVREEKPVKAAAAKPKPKNKAKPTKKKAKSVSAGDEAARAFGRGLGKMNSMFGAFVDEYKKSSK